MDKKTTKGGFCFNFFGNSTYVKPPADVGGILTIKLKLKHKTKFLLK